MSENRKIMTVKIQRAIFGTLAVLVYNRDRSYCKEFPLDENFKKIMGKSIKSYFKVKIENDTLSVIKPVGGLDW